MKPGIPWSVKGIEQDAREAAKLAAKRSGMTLGEWLNSTILDFADDAPAPVKPKARPAAFAKPLRPAASAQPRPSAALERTASKLEDIAEHLARLSQRETLVSHAIPDQRGNDSEIFSRVLNRVDNNERQTVEAFTAVNDRLATLGRQMAQAAKARVETRVEESTGYQSLEKAIRNIVEHMEASEKRSRENFKSLQDRVTGMTAKAQNAPQEQVLRQAPAFTQLEQRLADLASRIDKSETEKPKQGLPDLLKQELSELAGRIDTVRDTAEGLAQRAQTQAVQSSQQELRAIEQRIVGLIREAQSSLSGNGAGPAEMQRLRGEVERLNSRIDDAARAQAQGSDVLALRAAVEQLSTRVAEGADLAPLHDMDRRILTLSQQLERTQAETRSLPQFGEIERRLTELDYKLNEAVMGRSSAAAADVEDRLAEIAGRVERTEQQLTSLETIERAVNQLFESLEQQKSWTQQVVEEATHSAAHAAASQVAQQFMAQGPQSVSLAGAPEIEALQQGIHAVRMASEGADQRNQETLEAVHETLEQIVGKLAELETAAIGQRVHQAMQLPEAFAAAPAMPMAASFSDSSDVFATPATEQPQLNNPFAPTLEVPPVDVVVSNPFDAAPGNAALLQKGRESLQAGAVQADADDFIAAARKAAQASFQPRSMLSGVSPDLARVSEEGSKKLLSLSMFKRKAKDNAGKVKRPGQVAGAMAGAAELSYPPGFKQPANDDTAKRRKLILMGLVLLAAVSAFTFNIIGGKRAGLPATPAAIEQTMEQKQPAAEVPAKGADNQAIDKFQEEDVDDGAATAGKPKPAELESQLETENDSILTGAISAADGEQDIGSLIAATDPTEASGMPPAEVGTMALREAAAQGDAQAQFVIATRYLNGEMNVPQDNAKAAYWYGKSAAQGLAPAQYRLGTLYERGKGVARDLEAALGWYERSASLGNVKAMHNAAVLSASSDGRAPDYARAYKWFALGAAHGLKDSQFNLAVLLERGLGTKANPGEALFWYSAAGRQNDADAARRAEALAKSVNATDALAVKTRLQKWNPDSAPDTANVVSVSEPEWNAQGATG